MARIRTIKPEFPQSESMGRVSREARLAFIMLWTIADDAGRLRGNSRMLASLLYPYDDDAPKLMPKWLGELEQEGCVIVYEIEANTYIQICNWLNHQKIDKPSQSKIPEVANPREPSRTLPVGSKDQGVDQGKEGNGVEPKQVATRLPQDWTPPSEYLSFCRQERKDLDPMQTAASFKDYWIAKPGAAGKKLDWAATWRNWVRNQRQTNGTHYSDDRKDTYNALTGSGLRNEPIDITPSVLRLGND